MNKPQPSKPQPNTLGFVKPVGRVLPPTGSHVKKGFTQMNGTKRPRTSSK